MGETARVISLVVALALVFDFTNGFHDTANVVATSVATRALAPGSAVVLACVMNLAGSLAFTGVAGTISGRIADPFALSDGPAVALAAVCAALAWNLGTWYLGLPSSSSHALIGALAGAAAAGAGYPAINGAGLADVLKSLALSPLLAAAAGFFVLVLLRPVCQNRPLAAVNRNLRRLQVLFALVESFAHGTNDAQKTMGVITLALVAGGFQTTPAVPLWVKMVVALALAAGTASGGWRIVRTVGSGLTRLVPGSGLAADLASAAVIFGATLLSLPVSSTHVVSSSITGVALAGNRAAIRWRTVRRIAAGWVVTLPACFAGGSLAYWVLAAGRWWRLV